ncbi:MAG: M24 family metallopeptidase [Gemmatimonadota bacterium]|nr:M24 family metallopeptidase [Gemmatimonadota bacterium]MDE2866781.1 M24 family metallopeptidase [Gemmatimonadota bacterium]MYB06334.1 aminopeptidase P family protein [Gemmatimonadota bacterium]MYG21111.1 aminopeptidase P family protein [Gemmatimonadota bacterium]MYJ38348.1 aminopeptidase P family protein [Gemmatimonadota bacterium]
MTRLQSDTSGVLLASAEGVARVQAALRERGFDGWLIYDFKDRNPIGRSLLGLEWTTRRGFALVPSSGQPRLLIHAIEHSSWRHLDWPRASYSSRQRMQEGLRALLTGCKRVAAETSSRGDVPYLDLIPAGMRDVILDTGVELCSSGDLVSTFYAVWTPAQREEHGRASQLVKDLAREAFARAAEHVSRGETITEGALASWIRSELAARGAPAQADCIVAIGPTAADPHYDPGEVGEPIRAGDLLLIDLWGACHDDSVPADQTWMGYFGNELPPRIAELWTVVKAARDGVVASLRERHARGEVIRGFEGDDVARGIITDAGYGEYFIHRTGHSIDRDIHGRGPNLDNLETRDDRILVPGVGFSVEPGIYIAGDVGIRTELNMHMGPDGPEVTVDEPQQDVFLLLKD